MEDLQVKLDELKTTLEVKLTQKAKDEVTAQVTPIQTQITELKNKPPEVKKDELQALEDKITASIAVIKDAADKNQPVIDKFVADGQTNNTKQVKSFNENLAEAITEKTDDIEKFIRKDIKNLVIELKTVGDMTIANVTGGTRYGQQFDPKIHEQPKRRVHVRQLLPVSSAGPGNTFTFMKEDGAGEGAIAPTLETSTKPQIDLDLVEATVNFETIAGWLRISRKAMRNIPGMIGFLQSRLPEKLLRVEDEQLLYGDGNTPNIKGIGTSGNFTAATTTGAYANAHEFEEKLITAIAQLEDANERYATAVLVRPINYYNFFRNKATTSGLYDLPKNYVFVNGTLYISGIPVYASTAVTAGDYFVGDFEMGAQIFVQEGMRIEFFEQDGTNVRENKVTVRIEETIAFPVYGSDYFIKGSDSDQS